MNLKEEILVIKEEKSDGCYIKQRYLLVLMAFFGLCNVSFIRSEVNVTILMMVNNTHGNENHTEHMKGTMNWSTTEEGIFLGAYFYGYVVGNIPGGWLVTRFGFRKTFPLAMFISAVINLFTPLAAYSSVYLATVIRAFIGMIQGNALPAVNTMWSHWAPPLERSIFVSFAISGLVLGNIIITPAASFIGQLCGWEAVYYFTGAFSIIWSILFYTLFTETPSTNPRISPQERNFIETSLGKTSSSRNIRKNQSIPWKSILTSKPVLATFIANFYNSWFNFAIPAVLPTFLVNILHFNLTESGFILVLPFLLQWVVTVIGGKVTDKIREKGYASTVFMRKFNTCAAFVCSSCLMVLSGYVNKNHTLTIAIVCLSFSLLGIAASGFLSNTLELAPRHIGIVVALSNTFACTSGFLGPLTAGCIITDKTDISQWRIFFWITCAIGNVVSILYALMASGVEQKWANDVEFNEKDIKQHEKLKVDSKM